MTNASNSNSFAAALTGQLETDLAKEIEATVEWAEFASQMETQSGSSKVTERMEYEAQNECSGAWTRLYGNTTDTSFIPNKDTQMDRATRFCSRLNVAYWEGRTAAYRSENPHVDKKHPNYSEVEAANDLEWSNILVNQREARLNHKRCLAKFNRTKNFYETLTGKAFVYQPYVEKAKASSVMKANAKLAAAMLDEAA